MADDGIRKWKFVVRGMPLPWRVLDSNLQGVWDLQVRQDDVFVISYPKSGTNWLRSIINCMLDCPEVQNNLSLPIELSMCSGTSQEELATAPPVYKKLSSWHSPRVMFTHLLPYLLPAQLFEKKAKIVYIFRNPKDVAVSYYHFRQTLKSKEPCPSSMEECLLQFIKGEVAYGSYFTHVQQYVKMTERSNFLLIKYEDLKKNELVVIRQVAAFLGKELDDQLIANISSQCSLEAMRQKFKETPQAMSLIIDGDFVRTGRVGVWKEMLTVSQSQRFEQLYEEHLGDTGLTVDYE